MSATCFCVCSLSLCRHECAPDRVNDIYLPIIDAAPDDDTTANGMTYTQDLPAMAASIDIKITMNNTCWRQMDTNYDGIYTLNADRGYYAGRDGWFRPHIR